MSTKKRPQVTYTERVPWQPTQLKLTAGMCGATDKLFVYHDWDAGGTGGPTAAYYSAAARPAPCAKPSCTPGGQSALP